MLNRDSWSLLIFLLHTDFQIQEIFPSKVANPIVCLSDLLRTSLFIGFATIKWNISRIWKPMWINQYITFFFKEHFKFVSICLDVFKGLCCNIATIMRKDTWKLNFYSRHFILKSHTDLWIGSEKGILHFTFTVIVCPGTGPGDRKLITDNLSLFVLNQTYPIAKSEASVVCGDAMPHEMNEFL